MNEQISANLKYLIQDLINAINDAAWTDKYGKPNLTGPTPHMETAVAKLDARIHPVCPTCKRRLGGIGA